MRARSHFLMLKTTMITVANRPSSGRGWRQKLNAGLYLAPMSAFSLTTHHSLNLPPPSTPILRIQIHLLPNTADTELKRPSRKFPVNLRRQPHRRVAQVD